MLFSIFIAKMTRSQYKLYIVLTVFYGITSIINAVTIIIYENNNFLPQPG